MLKQLKNAMIFAGALAATTATASAAVTVNIQADGFGTGPIRVFSEDGESWNRIGSQDLILPVQIALGISSGELDTYAIRQDNTTVYQSASYLNPPLHLEKNQSVTGSTDYIGGIDRQIIINTCNSKLDVGNGINGVHTFMHNVKVSLTGHFYMTNGNHYPPYQGHGSVPVEVQCEPYGLTEELTAPAPNIVKVNLGLSSTGPVGNGTLEYTGSCPMGITLNMLWETSPGGQIKSYVQHKDVAGNHNWTSTVFPVTTDQPVGNANMKKESKDLIVIPFAASTLLGGGQVAQDVPSNGLMAGGSGGGSGPQTGLVATNTGTDSGTQKYAGYFRLVAFKEYQTSPAFNFDGSVANTTLLLGKKMSDWRKYTVTCEPKQSTVALDSPNDLVSPPKTGVFNPDDDPVPTPKPKPDSAFDRPNDLVSPPKTGVFNPDDDPVPTPKPKPDSAFDRPSGNLTVPATQAPKRTDDAAKKDAAVDRIKALAAETKRKKAAAKAARDASIAKRKREAEAAKLKKQRQAKTTAAQDKRKRNAALKAAAKRKLAADAEKRKAAGSKQRAIPKRRSTATQMQLIRRR